MKKKAFLGVDPGLKGGYALVDYNLKIIDCGVFPFKSTIFDSRKFASILNKHLKYYEIFASFEFVAAMPGQGVCAMFTFGKITGELISVLKVLSIPYIEPKPLAWKSVVLAGMPWKANYTRWKADKSWSEEELVAKKKAHNSIKNKAKKIAKAVSCKYVAQQYPELDISFGKKDPHDGIADAICLAQYAFFFKAGKTK